MARERRAVGPALAASLLAHGALLSLSFGSGPGLPGFDLPWRERRAEVPLRVRLSDPRPAVASAREVATTEGATATSARLAKDPAPAPGDAPTAALPPAAELVAAAPPAAAEPAAATAVLAPSVATPAPAMSGLVEALAPMVPPAAVVSAGPTSLPLLAPPVARAPVAEVRPLAAAAMPALADVVSTPIASPVASLPQAVSAEASAPAAEALPRLSAAAPVLVTDRPALPRLAVPVEAPAEPVSGSAPPTTLAEAARQEAARQAQAQLDAARLQAAREQDERREAARRAMGRQLDEERARRDAAAAQAAALPYAWNTPRRGRLLGRYDRNGELVQYGEAWARRIELNMTLDMVREAARQRHTPPVVTVAVRRDGSVESVTFVVSSGVPALDEAVRRIVQSLAPFPAFPPALARDYDVVEIRRTWGFDVAVRLY